MTNEHTMKQINPCNFPTRVLLVDDSSQALEKLERVMDDSHATYLPFSKPQEALNYINSLPSLAEQWTIGTDDDILDADISDIYREVYNPERYTHVSTIVVDYDMPALNGLELCEQITSPHIQKILLTGAADEEIAIQAFNRGLIQYFIRKQDPDALDLLDNYILDSQLRYFKSLSQGLIRQISHETSAINDPAFVELFQKITKENNICEHYLFEGTGSFLMMNQDGHPSALFTFTDELLGQNDEMIDELTQEGNNPLPDGLLEDLLNHRKALCFHYFDGLAFPEPSEWSNYTHDIQVLKGRETYYWAYIPHLKEMPTKGITSFNKFKGTSGK